MIFNDITARDIQRREMESGVFSFCKAIDTFCPLGPWIVTPDEIGDPHDLAMELRVNGESRQRSHSGNMSVTIPEILVPLLGARIQRGRRRFHGHRFRRRRLLGGRGLALPQARRRDRGGDREDRRAAEPRGLLGGGPRRAAARARAVVEPLADGVGLLGPLDELFPDMSETDWAPYRDRYPELVSGNDWRLPIMCFLVRAGETDDRGGHRRRTQGAVDGLDARAGVAGEAACASSAARGRARRRRHRLADARPHRPRRMERQEDGSRTFPRARYLLHEDALAAARRRAGRVHIDRCVLGIEDIRGGRRPRRDRARRRGRPDFRDTTTGTSASWSAKTP